MQPSMQPTSVPTRSPSARPTSEPTPSPIARQAGRGGLSDMHLLGPDCAQNSVIPYPEANGVDCGSLIRFTPRVDANSEACGEMLRAEDVCCPEEERPSVSRPQVSQDGIEKGDGDYVEEMNDVDDQELIIEEIEPSGSRPQAADGEEGVRLLSMAWRTSRPKSPRRGRARLRQGC